MTSQRNPPNFYRIIQANLRHSKTATANLVQTIMEGDAALVQEPFTTIDDLSDAPTIPDIPQGYSTFHKIGFNERLRSSHHSKIGTQWMHPSFFK